MQNIENRIPRIEAACERFLHLYGPGEIRMLRAPARINILGEHVDYVSYLPTASLPFGSHEHEMIMLYRPDEAGMLRGASGHARYEPFQLPFDVEFDTRVDANLLQRDWATLVFNRPAPAPHWSNYVRGAVAFAQWRHPDQITRGLSFLIDSTIPPGGGSSSSSAIVVLAGAAIREVNGIACSAVDLAWESSQAEWYLGTRGGALDHTAICLGRRDHALLMDHHQRTSVPIPVPGDPWRWVTFFSNPADKGREVMLEYNERAAVSRLLIPALLDRETPAAEQIEHLPETLTLDQFSRRAPDSFADCRTVFPALVRDRSTLPLRIRDRARHHLGEARRVAAAVQLLATQTASTTTDSIMEQLGHLLDQSHQSLRELYEVTNSEVDQLVEAITTEPALIAGRRLMGGGFGGNILVLCRQEQVDPLIERVQRLFYQPRGRVALAEGSIMISTPGEGLSQI
jgi:galactokinase